MKFFEKNHIKITLALMITIISASFAVGVAITETRSKINNDISLLNKTFMHLSIDIQEGKMDIDKLENENTDVKVRLATIETKLNNIELLLIDIKKDVRRRK